jgi:sarcosine oxidase gamma subunit
VPELSRTEVAVLACLAAPEAVDALAIPEGATPLRTAPDELLLLCGPSEAPAALAAAADAVRALDEDALVLEVSDGWTAFTLAGPDAREAFARLSALELPEHGSLQGDVARVPAKVLAGTERLHLLVPSSWAEHVRERILGLALEVREAPEPRTWEATDP